MNRPDDLYVQHNAAAICELTGNVRVGLAVLCGSGLGKLAHALSGAQSLGYDALQGFPRPTVAGHAGELVFGYLYNVPVLLLKGREHYYEHGNMRAMQIPFCSLKAAGVDTILLTNAAGSVQREMGIGSLMLITDHLFFSAHNPLAGEQGDDRFVDMSQAYDATHRAAFRVAAGKTGIRLHEGVYMWFAGPSFETPAEGRAAKLLGADAIGMSTANETILARHCGLKVAGLSVITALTAGMDTTAPSHEQVMIVADKAVDDMNKLVAEFARNIEAA